MTNLLTAVSIPIAPSGGFRGFGPLGLEELRGLDAPTVFTKFISMAIGLMSIVAIIWFVFLVIIGGYGYMAAGGDKAKIEKAQKTITSGLIGLAITVFAVFIIKLIGSLLGINLILSVTGLLGTITGDIVQ